MSYERDDEAFGGYVRAAFAQGFIPARDFVAVSALAVDDPHFLVEALLADLGSSALADCAIDASCPGWVIYWRRESFERFSIPTSKGEEA